MSKLDDYTEAWNAQPWWRRALRRVHFWLDSVWCAVLCEAGPAERMLILTWVDERKDLCEACLAKSTGAPPS